MIKRRPNTYLPQRISGVVVKGRGQGKKLGMPTANLAPHGGAWPNLPHGVYVSRAYLGKRNFPSVTSFGPAETFGLAAVAFETHIIGLNANIYEQELEVELLTYLRPLKKFDSVSELIAAMEDDCEIAAEQLSTNQS